MQSTVRSVGVTEAAVGAQGGVEGHMTDLDFEKLPLAAVWRMGGIRGAGVWVRSWEIVAVDKSWVGIERSGARDAGRWVDSVWEGAEEGLTG